MRVLKGFTLVELLIALAVAIILTAIAVPAYSQLVMKYRRGDASAAVSLAALELENCRSRTLTYTGCAITANSSNGFYTVAANIPDGTSYTLTATPVAGTTQANDAGCTTLTLTSTGVRGYTGSAADVGDCWR